MNKTTFIVIATWFVIITGTSWMIYDSTHIKEDLIETSIELGCLRGAHHFDVMNAPERLISWCHEHNGRHDPTDNRKSKDL